MLATTMGIVVPVPSAVVRSTSNREVTSEWLGTTKTSSYVRSYGGRCPSRNFICDALLFWPLRLYFVAVAAPERVELAGGVDALIGVGTEEVALRLGQCGGQAIGTQTVVVGQRRGEAWYRNTQLGGGDHHAPPAVDALLDGVAEVRCRDQRGQVRPIGECFFDPIEELRADDAAATPNGGQIARVDVPAVLGAARRDLVEPWA